MLYVVYNTDDANPVLGIFDSQEAAHKAISEAVTNWIEHCKTVDPKELGLDANDPLDRLKLTRAGYDYYHTQEIEEMNKLYE